MSEAETAKMESPAQQMPTEANGTTPTEANGTTSIEANGATPTKTNGTHSQSHYELPDAKTLEEVGELPIKDENGKEIQFKSLYENQPGRQLIVFIRHFYCGHCEEFIRYLAKNLPPKTLSATTPPTTLTVIGCGEIICIPDYRTRTMTEMGSDAYQIYADRDRAIYTKLGMVTNLKPSPDGKPEYIPGSVAMNALSSMKNIVFGGSKGQKGGKYSQNGGEWLFEGGELKWCRRMRNTQDHVPLKELKEVLGLN